MIMAAFVCDKLLAAKNTAAQPQKCSTKFYA